MAKKIKLTEKGLTNIIKNILEQELEDETLLDIEDIPETGEDDEDLLQDLEAEVEQILSPEEILGLMDEQIHQLQDRVQYMEELNADVLEFISYLMSDLSNSPEIDLKKSKAKLRNLETRSGREIFWLKSRRL
jgi:hypothetical protein|tara:strand:+ start:546 stop:944 length:399 start_codon:yes stop_codon:yes gene_type:complete